MHVIDYVIFGLYLAGVVGIGYYHFRKNENAEDYYVGSRSVEPHHVGLSIVATDVGGGFSIGLGGLGFTMGLSGSWLLFTGFVGAWLSAVFVIPKIKRIDKKHAMFSYPDFLRFRYGESVALFAALISGIGYLGFTGAQIQAGATLASETVFIKTPFGLDISPFQFSLFAIAAIAIGYTVIGGLKAVIYTDSVQWAILLFGLIVITIPVAIWEIGGLGALLSELPENHYDLFYIFKEEPIRFVNWMVTIIPIWLIGMTLYQRMFACRDEKAAKRAWYIAGVFEWPVMAFMGVILGMCARVIFPELTNEEAEFGLPRLINEILPIGVTGIVIASYFSAIMSTADSCLMASSGNFVNDIIHKHFAKNASDNGLMKLSQIVTLVVGIIALFLASTFTTVLDAILLAYAFMVSGLFIPTLGAYFTKWGSTRAALISMIAGGGFTLAIISHNQVVKEEDVWQMWAGLDPAFYGILISGVAFAAFSFLLPDSREKREMLGEMDPVDAGAGVAEE